MPHPQPTEKAVSDMLEILKPLGFVGTGEHSMKFDHTGLNRQFDFSSVDPEKAPRYAIQAAFQQGVGTGIEAARFSMRSALGLE